jgi:hypothetical protein
MSITLTRAALMLLACVAFPATAADALFRSGFEFSICDISFAESEPDDTAGMANVVGLEPATKSAMICGVISPAGSDVDYFEISTSAGTNTMLIETIRADGAPCDSDSPMSLALFDASAAPIAMDNNGGVGGCASLDYATDSALINLPPGNYFIRESANFNTPVYALRIKLR